MRLSLLVVAALGLVGTSSAHAEISASCRVIQRDFQLSRPHRAYAASPDGHCGFSSGKATAEEARRVAMDYCARNARRNCQVETEDFDGGAGGSERAPAIAPFRIDPDHLFHGARAARGVIVWSHGRNSENGVALDSRNRPSPPLIRAFSNAGWDIYRFDRDPATESIEGSGSQLVAGVDRLRAAGYQRIILAGQSYGAWLSLRALDYRQDLYGIIALAPAHHGDVAKTRTHTAALRDFGALVDHFQPSRTRVLLALFQDDPYDPDGEQRHALASYAAARAGMPFLSVADDPDLTGHSGGLGLPMAQRYAACVLRFFEGPPDADACRTR